MQIQVLGSGCTKCKKLFDLTKQSVEELNLKAEIEYVTDVQKIVQMGLMSSPVLAIDGKPVLVGILPLVSLKHANFLNHEVPGISIPDKIIQRMERAGEDAAEEGIRIAVELIEQIKPWAHGVYLMPQFSRFDLIAEIIEKVKEQR